MSDDPKPFLGPQHLDPWNHEPVPCADPNCRCYGLPGEQAGFERGVKAERANIRAEMLTLEAESGSLIDAWCLLFERLTDRLEATDG